MEKVIRTYEEIMNDALALPPNERGMLAEHLIESLEPLESLDSKEQERIDALWLQEAERRYKEIEDGIVEAIPGEEVINRLRARYKR